MARMTRTCTFLILFFLCASISANETLNLPVIQDEISIRTTLQAHRIEVEEALELQDYVRVKSLYTSILKLNPENYLSLEEYQDLLISQAYSEAYLNKFDEANLIIQKLDLKLLTLAQLYRKEMLEAKLLYSNGEFKKTMSMLLNMTYSTPLANWPKQERSFYLKVSQQSDQYFEALIDQAEHSFDASLYQEARPLYQETLVALEEGLFSVDSKNLYFELALRLAHTEFFLENYSRAKELFIQLNEKLEDQLDLNSLYLLVLACEETEQYQEALYYSRNYLNQGPHSSSEQLEAMRFEVARIYYKYGQEDKAHTLFLQLIQDLKSTHYQYLSRFYEARILLKKGSYDLVESILNPDHFDFSTHSALQYDWAYLRAEAFFQRNEYAMAVAGFEESLPKHNREKADWYPKALYNLGWSYLKLGEDTLSQKISQTHNFTKAEDAFRELLEIEESDQTYLALARVYLLKARYLKDPEASSSLKELLGSAHLKNDHSKLKMGMSQAEMSEDLYEKEAIYASLSSLASKTLYDLGYLNRARIGNLFDLVGISQDPKHYEDLDTLLDESLSLMDAKESKDIEPLVKVKVIAALNQGDKSSLKRAYQFLESFPNEYKAYYQFDKIPQLLLYFKALVASRLMQLEDSDTFFQKGKEAIDSLMSSPKQSTLADQALYLLGTLFYHHEDFAKARHTFLKLIETYPKSSWIGDAWYWAAECNDQEKHDPNISREYRKKVFEDYPESSHAPEAFFYYYSFSEYLQGNPEALSHLEKMEELFKNSPFLVVSYYLRALDKKEDHLEVNGKLLAEKDLNQSLLLFNKSKETFLQKYKENQIGPEHLNYLSNVYYRSLLGEAQVFLMKADTSQSAKRQLHLEQAITAYLEMVQQFEEESHPLAALFYKEIFYPELLEEAEFGLAKAFIRNFKLPDGEQKLNSMIEKYHRAGVEKNYYHSRAWYELSLISMAKEEHQEALDYLNRSEQSADDRMTSDQIIDLGIQQSLCYRCLNQLDMAMLTLSKIINEGIISNLRVKAMYLRAEIYELQGRQELAQRQLEAASKKGGEWARMSQDRLIAEYGFN